MIACQSHEVWALNKQRAGYIYGITRNDGEDGEQKTHPEMVPFCVLTDDNKDQTRARSGGEHGNKGTEAAVVVLKMLALGSEL